MIIALIDDDEAVLHSLDLFLRGQGKTVECFASARAFLNALTLRRPDCIVSDIRMPGMTGLELQRELNRRGTLVPFILLTGHGDIAIAVRAMKEGAYDFIEKPYDANRLLGSIETAISTECHSRSRQKLKEEIIAQVEQLTPRQVEVMRMVADGLSSKHIAIRLGISPRTVENYRAWIMERLHAKNTADLVRKVVLLDLEQP